MGTVGVWLDQQADQGVGTGQAEAIMMTDIENDWPRAKHTTSSSQFLEVGSLITLPFFQIRKQRLREVLQSHTADGWQKQHVTQVCLMPHPDLLTTGMPGSGMTEPFPFKVPLSQRTWPGISRQTHGSQRLVFALTMEAAVIQPPPLRQRRDYQDLLHQNREDERARNI